MKGTIILTNNYTYVGDIENDEPHGYGKFQYDNNHSYIGECRFGKPDGYGTYYFDNVGEIQYCGYFSTGRFNGIGTYKNHNFISKGTWRNDKRHGFFIKTDIVNKTSIRQMWFKGKLRQELFSQYIQPDALKTTKKNLIKSKKLQTSYKGNEKKCIGCHENFINATIANCGHVCMCFDCLCRCDKCPMCRGPLDQIVKLYIS